MALQFTKAEDLRNSINVPVGLPNNKWPAMASDRFADGTVADGNPSKWEVAQ